MIINKQGEKCLCSNGVEYIIGEEVIGTENGDYEGLIGRIYEIRIGEADKETDNDTSDFYCTFEPPILEPDIRKLEERFSQIYGSPKSLNDICLDSVILAPDMVKPVSSIEDEAKECNVYVLEEDWAANDDYGHDVDIFTDLNSAKISMLKQLKKENKELDEETEKSRMIKDIEDNGLKLDDNIGSKLKYIREAYRGSKKNAKEPTPKQVEKIEEDLGIKLEKKRKSKKEIAEAAFPAITDPDLLDSEQQALDTLISKTEEKGGKNGQKQQS